jgi:hypothetical protein
MLKNLAIVALTSSFALSAFAAGGTDLRGAVELKDGSTVHIFQDGKMGMEDKVGRSFLMAPGHVMETRDGRRIEMNGNEVWRVEALAARYRG